VAQGVRGASRFFARAVRRAAIGHERDGGVLDGRHRAREARETTPIAESAKSVERIPTCGPGILSRRGAGPAARKAACAVHVEKRNRSERTGTREKLT
jgi:hypothetical protein